MGRWEQTDSPIKDHCGSKGNSGQQCPMSPGHPLCGSLTGVALIFPGIRSGGFYPSCYVIFPEKKNQDQIRIKPGGISVPEQPLPAEGICGWGPPRREFIISVLEFCVGAASVWEGWAAGEGSPLRIRQNPSPPGAAEVPSRSQSCQSNGCDSSSRFKL